MDAVKMLEVVLTAFAVSLRVDELVAEYDKRKAAGATDDELAAWIRSLADSSINAAQKAINDQP